MSEENTIKRDGDTWRIVGLGAMCDGKIYCHLASTTRGVQQKTGWNPMQIGDWVDVDLVRPCLVQREEEERQLLELAAKAVGCIKQENARQVGWELVTHKTAISRPFWMLDGRYHSQWNPLEDDGAALRLAVKLGLCVAIFPKDHETMVGYPKGEHDGANIIEPHNSDPFAATRRAIVTAAAEIGRKMGDTK